MNPLSINCKYYLIDCTLRGQKGTVTARIHTAYTLSKY